MVSGEPAGRTTIIHEYGSAMVWLIEIGLDGTLSTVSENGPVGILMLAGRNTIVTGSRWDELP